MLIQAKLSFKSFKHFFKVTKENGNMKCRSTEEKAKKFPCRLLTQTVQFDFNEKLMVYNHKEAPKLLI